MIILQNLESLNKCVHLNEYTLLSKDIRCTHTCGHCWCSMYRKVTFSLVYYYISIDKQVTNIHYIDHFELKQSLSSELDNVIMDFKYTTIPIQQSEISKNNVVNAVSS